MPLLVAQQTNRDKLATNSAMRSAEVALLEGIQGYMYEG